MKGWAALAGGVVALLALVYLLSTVGIRGYAHDDEGAGAVPIRVAINADIRGTNPGVTRDGNTDAVINHVVEALVALREDLTVAPMLAEDIAISGDGLTYRFTLRDGLRFHNGAPVTAREVKWSWDRMLDPETGFRCRRWYDGSDRSGLGGRLTDIAVLDDRTVEFRFAQANPMFLDMMASPQCVTAILHPDSVAEDGSWIAPIGTGPYKISQWQRGQFIELERFTGYKARDGAPDGYAGSREPQAELVRFVIIPEISVAKAALDSGDIDILPRVPPYLLQAGATDGLQQSSAEMLSWDVLLMQTNDPLLSDVRMRKAIAHAIDVRQVTAIATLGGSRANPSTIARATGFHDAFADDWYDYDPDKARGYLEEAGYAGEPIFIQTNRKYPLLFDSAVAIQAMLAAVGIDARLEVYDWATQLSNYASGNFQLATFGYSGRSQPLLAYAAFTGSKDANPNVQWDSAGARALIEAGSGAKDRQAFEALFRRLHETMRDEVPMIGLYNENAIDLIRPDVAGYESWSMGTPRLWTVRREGD